MTQDSDNEKFAKVVEAPGYLPLMTKDVDVAVGSSPPPGKANMRERLLAAEFKEEMSGEHRPPITYYQIGSAEQPFYVEFLTPLVGSEGISENCVLCMGGPTRCISTARRCPTRCSEAWQGDHNFFMMRCRFGTPRVNLSSEPPC